MGFYDLSKDERNKLTAQIHADLLAEFLKNQNIFIKKYFSDEDTYIRKAAYISTGRIFKENLQLRTQVIRSLENLLQNANEKIRQTAINAAGEIGMIDLEMVKHLFEKGLADSHHVVRNAVIGSFKKMSEKNPEPVLKFAREYIHHPDIEIRREMCHGIELRGRTHPEDVLPILQELEFDTAPRVYNTIIHVIGQISYKKGCLEKVVTHLKNWKNTELVKKALKEILEVHKNYQNFSARTVEAAKEYIEKAMVA
ncbi:HEAT repeat domain-containing protein [candidate division KSB1 bacterium]|nr:HEAT repeat domain-containing protein [candidate division KSB1 bacterium]